MIPPASAVMTEGDHALRPARTGSMRWGSTGPWVSSVASSNVVLDLDAGTLVQGAAACFATASWVRQISVRHPTVNMPGATRAGARMS
jgi:hypothetical protein